MRGNLLLISEDQSTRNVIGSMLRRKGYGVTTSFNLIGNEISDLNIYDLALVDQHSSNLTTNKEIDWLKQVASKMRVILLADHQAKLSSIEMLRDYLFAFHTKPLDLPALDDSIQNAISQVHSMMREKENNASGAQRNQDASMEENDQRNVVRITQKEEDAAYPGCSFLGESESIRRVRQQINEVAPTGITVLIRGESGVGKGVVASQIHAASKRGRKDKLVHINCAAIPDSLIESELFGHEAGAFTGADKSKPGRFEFASGGTIFLDEIGEVPLSMQVKLLNVIEQKEIYHLGGRKPIHMDVRFLTATNAPLDQLISVGKFRADLFYRLNEFCIDIPPLRERIEDIPILVDHFTTVFGEQYGRKNLKLSMEMLALLMKYKWPGNVRELETVIRRYALSGRNETIIDLVRPHDEINSNRNQMSMLNQNEVQTIMTMLVQNRWNQRRAAKALGISYSALRRRVEKYGLKN